MNDIMERLNKLASDDAKASEIFSGSLEEIRENLASHGIILTDKEFQELQISIQNAEESDELSEEDLDNVAGGCIICDIVRAIVKIIIKFKDRLRKRS